MHVEDALILNLAECKWLYKAIDQFWLCATFENFEALCETMMDRAGLLTLQSPAGGLVLVHHKARRSSPAMIHVTSIDKPVAPGWAHMECRMFYKVAFYGSGVYELDQGCPRAKAE